MLTVGYKLFACFTFFTACCILYFLGSV